MHVAGDVTLGLLESSFRPMSYRYSLTETNVGYINLECRSRSRPDV